jgi:hypothetical protein
MPMGDTEANLLSAIGDTVHSFPAFPFLALFLRANAIVCRGRDARVHRHVPQVCTCCGRGAHLSPEPPPPCSMAKTASEEGFDEVLQLCSLLSLHLHLL